jgi:DNA-binding response OmpR family regulator
MKILVAEDEIILQKTISLKLRKDGHETFMTDNGLDAFKLFEQHSPDLIITDIMMPYSSGLELISKVKETGSTTKIIVLSSMGQENVIVEAFNLGADDFITKPFSPIELSMRVKRLLT